MTVRSFLRQSLPQPESPNGTDTVYVHGQTKAMPGSGSLSYLSRQCHRQGCGSVFIWYGSGSGILGWIPIQIRIPGFDDQKLKNSWNLQASIKDVQVTKEAFSSQKRTSISSKHEISQFFSTFVGNFCPPGSGFRIRIRIHWPDWIRIQ